MRQERKDRKIFVVSAMIGHLVGSPWPFGRLRISAEAITVHTLFRGKTCPKSIGFEGDDVSVAGINPWKVVNRSSTGEKIIVAHPSYPAQRHTMRVYVLDPEHGGSVFAAGEFSNGVWGIYVPVAMTPGESRSRTSSS